MQNNSLPNISPAGITRGTSDVVWCYDEPRLDEVLVFVKSNLEI